MRNRAIAATEYPAGAIRKREDLLDVIIEARKEKKAIRIYIVSQGGYFLEGFLTSKSKIDKIYEFEQFHFMAKSSFSHDKYYRNSTSLGDHNIGRLNGYNRHMVFTNRRHAENYSNTLKNDKEYQQAVQDWHAECSKMLRNLGEW